MSDFIGDLDSDLAHDIIEEEIRNYIVLAYATAKAGLPKTPEDAVDQMRWLHLAEPWLPATAAMNRLRAAGLLQ